uniref:Uncharacterized protein n=1 Tax=Knipowitschia caucasica TaxID=637954 RepID=A0AAV2LQY9_KNICA
MLRWLSLPKDRNIVAGSSEAQSNQPPPNTLKTNPGPRLKKFLSEVEEGGVWQGVKLSTSRTDDSSFQMLKSQLIDKLVNFISERYNSLDTGRKQLNESGLS